MVHLFTIHGLQLALDVESGALHILDEASYLAIEKISQGFTLQEARAALQEIYGPQAAGQVSAEIEDLMRKDLLFSKPRQFNSKSDGVVKALCLHLAHECNMSCSYCFASEGNYGSSGGLMPLHTAIAAVDFLLAASKNRQHCEIDFFGGEPLLNFSVLKDTVAYGKEQAATLGKQLKFTVTTNALGLSPEIIEFLNAEQMSVVLSLDGRQDVHDRMRKKKDGSGSWQQVLENSRKLVLSRADENYYLRGTYTRHNLDFCADVLEMARHGFTQLSLEPAVLAPDAEETLQKDDLPLIFSEYEKLAGLLWEWEQMGRKIYFFHFELDLQQGPCAKKRALGCGAGSAYLAVTPDGRLYPCHQFAQDDDFCIGDLQTGINSPQILQRFAAVDSAMKAECKDCFARFFCGGGCHAAAWHLNHALEVPYSLGCELHRKRVECGLYLQAKRMLASQRAGDDTGYFYSA